MPKFFFHVFDATGVHRDRSGQTFVDAEAAWAEGAKVASDLLRDLCHDLKPGQDWRLEIADAAGNAIYAIRFVAEQIQNGSGAIRAPEPPASG